MMRNYRETSREAYDAIKGTVTGDIDREIIDAIFGAGEAGITDQEIETATGRPHQTISANRRHLVENGFVQHNGEFGKTGSGRKARRWIIAAPKPDVAGLPLFAEATQ